MIASAKSTTWTTAVAAAVLAVVATAWSAAASPWPPADVTSVEPASPLLATVDVELARAPPASPALMIATASDVELALETPRSWRHLKDLERLSETVLWGFQAPSDGVANPWVEARLRLKTRVWGYQQIRGGNEAVARSLLPVLPMGFGASCTAEASGGVFLTTDPLGYIDGPNLYQYGLNNPVNFSDPMGLAVYAFDGTGNDQAQMRNPTNVWKLCHSVRAPEQCFYSPGVGSGAGTRVVGGGTGLGGQKRLEAMYQILVQAYNEGDTDIDIIGFSRGTALAREFANMIAERGIPVTGGHETENVGGVILVDGDRVAEYKEKRSSVRAPF